MFPAATSVTAILLESTLRFRERNYAWTRIKNVDHTTELLLGDNSSEPVPGFSERYFTAHPTYTQATTGKWDTSHIY